MTSFATPIDPTIRTTVRHKEIPMPIALLSLPLAFGALWLGLRAARGLNRLWQALPQSNADFHIA